VSYIANYNAAFPQFTVTDEILHPKGKMNKHAVSYVDEDIITLAFEASRNLDPNVDAIIFATTTPVFKDRYHASFLADLLNIPDGITALDLGTTTRCGTDALMLANTWVNGGKCKKVLIVAVDVRFPAIGKEVRTPFGHGAVAMIISKHKGLVEISNTASFSASMTEEFLYKGNKVQFDNRFARTTGFKNNIELALQNLDANTIDSLMVNSLYSKLALGILKKAGFDLDRQILPDTMISQFGHIGGAHGLLRIIQAIQDKKHTSVLIDYGNGTNVITINKTKSAIKPLMEEFENRTATPSYQDYLILRKQGKFERKGFVNLDHFSSEMMQVREKNQFIHLKGFECESCGTVYYMKAARCNNCRGISFNEKQLSSSGTVYSLTAEYYFPSSFPPTNMIIIDLDGGGRLTLQQTDDMYQNEESKINIGDKVELVLRKMMENDNKPNYFWKCKPI